MANIISFLHFLDNEVIYEKEITVEPQNKNEDEDETLVPKIENEKPLDKMEMTMESKFPEEKKDEKKPDNDLSMEQNSIIINIQKRDMQFKGFDNINNILYRILEYAFITMDLEKRSLTIISFFKALFDLPAFKKNDEGFYLYINKIIGNFDMNKGHFRDSFVDDPKIIKLIKLFSNKFSRILELNVISDDTILYCTGKKIISIKNNGFYVSDEHVSDDMLISLNNEKAFENNLIKIVSFSYSLFPENINEKKRNIAIFYIDIIDEIFNDVVYKYLFSLFLLKNSFIFEMDDTKNSVYTNLLNLFIKMFILKKQNEGNDISVSELLEEITKKSSKIKYLFVLAFDSFINDNKKYITEVQKDKTGVIEIINKFYKNQKITIYDDNEEKIFFEKNNEIGEDGNDVFFITFVNDDPNNFIVSYRIPGIFKTKLN